MGVRVIGAVPQGLPAPRVPLLDDLSVLSLLPYALGIAVVGYSDNVLTARAFAVKRKEPVDSNQELLALGAANVVNGFTNGFPVSSSGSRTVIGDAVGSRSQLYSLVCLALVIAALLVAIGVQQIKKGTPPTPTKTIDSIKQDVRVLKGTNSSGTGRRAS